MCGIWASIGLDPPRAVIEAVAHRGPDGTGWREFDTAAGRLVLGHRRLAVIDTSEAGLQPMSYADGRYWLVYNGMIYNHVELRRELESLGHRFRSSCDTEVLLAAYAEWGEACLVKLNGMFAFVVWDAEARTLFAARDRFGVKPLYWTTINGGFAFASEIKQFAACPGFTAGLDAAQAYDFLAYAQLDHSSSTFFRDVRQLRGGECLVLDLADRLPDAEIAPRRWYDRPVPAETEMSDGEAVGRLRDLLEDSVRLRLRSDVPVGFCLSGGLDSSAIVGLADGQDPARELVTVSACYDDRAIDERDYIDMVNARATTRPIRVFPSGDELAQCAEQVIYAHDGPVVSTSMFAQWRVFEAARDAGLTVMLDGQGADELLGGYLGSFRPFHAGLLRKSRFRAMWREMAAERRRHGTSVRSHAAALCIGGLPMPLRRALRRSRAGGRHDWLDRDFVRGRASPVPEFTDLEGLINSHMFETSLPMLLHFEDRNSMAHGIESRLPFLDHRVVELLIGLGARYKIVDGETKWLLRRAMSDVLPAAIRDRQDKIGFATPEHAWLTGPARSLVVQGVRDALERFPEIFSAPAVARLQNDTFEGRRRNDFTLWRIACFGLWARVFDVRA